MKRIYTIFMCCLSFITVSNIVSGQCNQDINLFSQDAVDNFSINYGCTEIYGNLTIDGFSIVNLLGLSDITFIEGYLRIYDNGNLLNVDGLSSLASVGEVYLWQNGITNIDGFSSLEFVATRIVIKGNDFLENVDGFSNLMSVQSIFLDTNNSLENVDGFSNITSLEGYLNIFENNDLASVEGFDNLTSIGGNFRFSHKNELINLNSFNSLLSIGGNLEMNGGYSEPSWSSPLTNISGFSNLVSVGGTFDIQGHIELVSIDGFNSLESIGGWTQIISNESLSSINGFNNLISVEGSITISGQDNLSEVYGFANVTSVGGIRIENNNLLTNFNGLINLTSIEGEFPHLIIANNNFFSNLNVFSNLTNIEGDLSIINNGLEGCCLIPYLAAITEGEVTIDDNTIGCNVIEEIADSCGISWIGARFFYDENGDNSFDLNEQALFFPNLPVTINPNASFGIDIETGNIRFFVNADTYIVQYDDTNNGLWEVVNGQNSYTIEISENVGIDTTLYFPMQPVTDFLIQNVDITSSITRCNQETNVWLTYTNKSSESTSGYVNLVANDLATFVSATPPVDSIAGDTLYWFYEGLYPTHSEQIKAIFEMAGVGEDGENVGENIVFDAQIETWEEYGNDKDLLSSELICAYDPNDKLVTPEGIGEENYTLFEDSLFNYTIRFQNTGNDTAFNIIIKDTISEHLNIETYQFIASSHEVSTKINESERTIEFQFNDIYLPDSNVNEVGSHGFVKFSIESNKNLAENTPIENTAGIYFDFNPPIITNTTQNLMVSEIPMTSLERITENKSFNIYPNPNTGKFTIDNKNRTIQKVKIYDVMGKLIQEQKANSSQINININANAGIYFLSLETKNGIFVEKIIIQ